MTNWKKKWDRQPRKFAETDFARQVERTIGGNPYTQEQVQDVGDRIVAYMNLQPTDFLLDLCCGNGLLTARLAKHCAKVVGADFSLPLIQIARRYHQFANTEYHLMDARSLCQLAGMRIGRFNKFLMYGAVQHFS